jgi:hypothetical protein
MRGGVKLRMTQTGFHGTSYSFTQSNYVLVECLYKDGINLGNRIIVDEVERRLTLMFNTTPPTQDSPYRIFLEDDILGRVLDYVQISEPSKMQDTFYHYRNTAEKAAVVKSDGEEQVDYFRTFSLPNVELGKIWPTLYFEGSVNYQLFNYVNTMLLTSSSGLDLSVFDLHK